MSLVLMLHRAINHIRRCYSQRSTSTQAWGGHSACNHLEPHGSCRSSCCSRERETKNKSTKKILNKNNSFFRTNCLCSTKRTGHCAWPCCSFSWSDCTCDHPSCHRTWCSLSPCCCVEGNCGGDCLDGNI